MVLTNKGRELVSTAVQALFTSSGVGIDTTAAYAADSELFGGGTTIDACDAITGWTAGGTGASVALNTASSDYLEGSGCINLVGTSGALTFSKTVSSADLAADRVAVWFYINNVSELTASSSAVSVMLGSTDATNSNEYYFANTDLSNGWNSLVCDVDTPSATNGAGATETAIDYIRLTVNITAAQAGNEMRMDHWRFYNAGTLGITDSYKAPTITSGTYYFKTSHQISAAESNGLDITEAGDSNGTYLLQRSQFAAVPKGESTEMQVDKFYYIDQQ